MGLDRNSLSAEGAGGTLKQETPHKNPTQLHCCQILIPPDSSSMCVHTHVNTHVCTRMCTVNTCMHMCAHKVHVHSHISTCVCMHTNMHAHICDTYVHRTCVHAHVFTQRLQDDFCNARFQLEALRVTGVLRAWSGILVKEHQAVSCCPHVLGQGGGPWSLLPHSAHTEPTIHAVGRHHTPASSSHTLYMCRKRSLWLVLPTLPLFLSIHLTKLRRQPGFKSPAHSSMAEATWRPRNPGRGGKVGRTQEV